MSHRPQPAPKLCRSRLSAPEPSHPEIARGVQPAYRPLIPQSAIRNPQSPRHALTLIEMLVALAVTLVMMAAVVNLFANISGSIRNRRAVIEVSGQLRQVRARLALDLAGATCKGTTWQRPDNDQGYIEIIEGPFSDMNPSILLDGDASDGEIDYATSLVPSGGDPAIDLTATVPPLTARAPQPGDVTNGRGLGDWDDLLALTVRSESEPFVAYDNGIRVESNLAEVLWFAIENPVDDPGTPAVDESNGSPGMRTIYRRVLLIAPTRGPWNSPPDNISARFDQSNNRWIANTLGDLTKRENRVERRPGESFPHPISGMGSSTSVERAVLSDALALDVRVYDPGAPLYEAGAGAVVQPGDPGWYLAAGAGGNPVGYGAYCDLGWNWDPTANAEYVALATPQPRLFDVGRRAGWHPAFSAMAPPRPLTGFPAVYDTWSFHYENDGVNQEQVLLDWASAGGISPPPAFADWQRNTLDQGTNGLDDDNVNGVDDPGERETSPPYDVPLRGVKVSLRIYEPDARQIRETSVTHSFAP